MAETVMDSLAGIDYTLRPGIYKVHEDRKAELLDVAEHGKLVLYAVAVGTDEIAQLVKETILPYAKAQQSQSQSQSQTQRPDSKEKTKHV